MSYRFSFSGIDGSGKSTTIDKVSTALANEGNIVVHIRRCSWVDIEGKDREYIATKVNGFFDLLHGWTDDRRYRSLVGIVNIGYSVAQRMMEKYAKSHFNPDIVLVGRYSNLDPFAYSAFYFPFVRNLSPKQRMQVVSFLHRGASSDMVFYFDVDPLVAYERILQRIEREQMYGTKDRAKWPHMHENPDDLKFLQEQFEISLELLVKENGTNIVRIDATTPPEDVVQEILSNISRVTNSTRRKLSLPKEKYLGAAKQTV